MIIITYIYIIYIINLTVTSQSQDEAQTLIEAVFHLDIQVR